jgi:hypothetical protein
MIKLPRAVIGVVSLALAATTAVSVVQLAPADASPNSAGLLFGASSHAATGLDITDVESQVGRTLAIERGYSRWDDAQPSTKVRNDVAVGRTPLLSISPQRANGAKLSWAGIASGAYDGEIAAQARGLASVGVRVLLAFHHEADLAGGYGSAADFRAAFRHYVAVVRSTGASNISFVVVLSAGAYGSKINDWYPGDDVVDYAGADAYNFGACRPGAIPWRSFATAVAPFRTWGEKHQKPLVLAEWGSAEDAATPGRKAQWIKDAGDVMRAWPQLRAASYFDQSGSCDWRLTTSSAALAAYRDLARSVVANASPTARLVGSVSSRTVTWRPTGSTGALHITGHGVTRWTFTPGDGTPSTSGTGTPPALTHRYGAAGSFTATLTVSDGTGRSATTHSTATVR